MLNFAYAQKKNTFKFNIVSPFTKSLAYYYERDLSDLTSAQVGFSFLNLGMTGTKYTGQSFSIIPEQRIYISKIENLKVYAAPFIQYRIGKIESFALENSGEPSNAIATFTIYGGGLLFGGLLLSDDFLVLDAFVGPSYGSGEIDVKSGVEGHFLDFDLAKGLLPGLSFRVVQLFAIVTKSLCLLIYKQLQSTLSLC